MINAEREFGKLTRLDAWSLWPRFKFVLRVGRGGFFALLVDRKKVRIAGQRMLLVRLERCEQHCGRRVTWLHFGLTDELGIARHQWHGGGLCPNDPDEQVVITPSGLRELKKWRADQAAVLREHGGVS